MEKRYVTVFSHRMCNALIQKGFHVEEVKKDRLYPERSVFFFRNSEKIREAMAEISK